MMQDYLKILTGPRTATAVPQTRKTARIQVIRVPTRPCGGHNKE